MSFGDERKPLKFGEAQAEFQRLLAIESDDCVAWPYANNGIGYGAIWDGRRMTSTHRLACLVAHGEPPSGGYEAAHSCHNRSCMNPRHLRWATVAENSADRLVDGTHARGERCVTAKLTEAQVLEIRRRYRSGGVTTRSLAFDYGVSQTQICSVLNGKVWAWLA